MYDRIYLQLKHNELLKHQFTIFLTLRDRTSKETINENMIYAGLLKQEELLSSYNREPCLAWQEMQRTRINIEDLPATSNIAEKYYDNSLQISDLLELKKVSTYYNLKEREGWPGTREVEYQVIENYFPDPQNSYFLTLPVFLFGEFEGVAQLIITEDDIDKDGNNQTSQYFIENVWPRIMKQIIRIFTREYEDLIWNWQLPAGNQKRSIKELRAYNEFKKNLFANASKVIAQRNKSILTDLGYVDYYKQSEAYYKWRTDENDRQIEAYLKEHKDRAVMAILLDSFAHNVSAHSLTVLKWIFQQKILSEHELSDVKKLMAKSDEQEPLSAWRKLAQAPADDFLESIAEIVGRWRAQARLKNENHSIQPLRHQIRQPNFELTQLLRYLTEKGAFWSGIGRNEQFGGEAHNLYDLLYNDFANNPLFLGTIAYSEGISKININIKIYEKRIDSHRTNGKTKEALKRTYQIARNEDGELLAGTIASIDMGNKQELHYQHAFFQDGPAHDLLNRPLEKSFVYLPGGVVGKHAFFTLLENTLRDVKHYSREEHDKMSLHGLDLEISIFPSKLTRSVRRSHNDHDLFKIGIWIAATQKLKTPKGQALGALSLRRITSPIIDQNQKARLGGSQQDKICAAMLMTGRFDQMEPQEHQLSKAYFPWVRYAHYYPDQQPKELHIEEEFEFRAGVRGEKPQEYQNELAVMPNSPGYIKKYVHFWRSKLIFRPTADEAELSTVDHNRHYLILVENRRHFAALRRQGAIRVLPNDNDHEAIAEAYSSWLKLWNDHEKYIIELKIGRSPCGYLVLEDNQCLYYNKRTYRQLGEVVHKQHATYPREEVAFEHLSQDGKKTQREYLRIRNHGALRTKFFKEIQDVTKFSQGSLKPSQSCELAEVLSTKICIFDERMNQRFTGARSRHALQEQLGLEVYPEAGRVWDYVKKKGLFKYNFLVFHISCLGQIEKEPGVPYMESDIVEFIEKEIVQGREVPDNFVFIVTSGRGRLKWWDKLSAAMENAPEDFYYTTFRQSESLINAIEDGLQLEDDFQIKYNLVKVLFGS
ncbi:MAG: hypothetical protein AAFO96_25760 [Bacteroidota bacterium]